MPELPEVETTMRGIAPYLQGQQIRQMVVRERRLRWPIAANIESAVVGQQVESLARRGKYILIHLQRGFLLIHLGMSGSMRVITQAEPLIKHDHVDIVTNDALVRYNDPRRFGSVQYFVGEPHSHSLLKNLGVEPLDDEFDAAYLWRLAQTRQVAIKSFIMDSHVVTGVGNIYAAEALFQAGIHPFRACNRISQPRLEKLVVAIKAILQAAIMQGGTTLQDFLQADGKPGYFKQELAVYGRAGQACLRCQRELRHRVLGQRATVYCPGCQR